MYLYDLSDVSSGIQMSLFTDDEELDRGARLAAVVDKLNTKFGRVMIKPAALYTAPGCGRIWQPKAEFRTGGGIGAPLERVRFQSHAEDYMV